MSEPTVNQPAAEREPDHVTPEPTQRGQVFPRHLVLSGFAPARCGETRPTHTTRLPREVQCPRCIAQFTPTEARHALDGELIKAFDTLAAAQRATPAEPDGLTPEQIEMDRQATALDDADDHFVIGQTSAGWPDTDLAPELGSSYSGAVLDAIATTVAAERDLLADQQLIEQPQPERRTVSLELATDELRQLAVRLARSDIRQEMAAAKVVVVLRFGGQPVAVPDTDVPWATGTPGEPVKALRGLLSEMIRGKNQLERDEGTPVELLMPTPDVLAALDGRPDAQLLTAPVWVLAMDVEPGMYLAPYAHAGTLVFGRATCSLPDCKEGASCVVLVVDGAEQHHGGYARTRVRIPVSVTR